ncbi:hypothetical protein C8Q74DRAFT_1295286 [Fomes fomentarius]|nr:hypothetical protein C8Q74DRAFT_1295286 [Fomes fomentarius]
MYVYVNATTVLLVTGVVLVRDVTITVAGSPVLATGVVDAIAGRRLGDENRGGGLRCGRRWDVPRKGQGIRDRARVIVACLWEYAGTDACRGDEGICPERGDLGCNHVELSKVRDRWTLVCW